MYAILANVVVRAQQSAGHVKLEAILLNRAAESRVEVPVLLQGPGRRQPAILQLLREVVPLHAAGREGREHGPGEGVPTVARNQVVSSFLLKYLPNA